MTKKYDHDEVRCEQMADADVDYKRPGEPRTCCVCAGHDCAEARAERAKHQPQAVPQSFKTGEEAQALLHNLALRFHAQSEHFDRQQPHIKNERGIAIPTGPARRACEEYARRLLQEMFMEHIYRKIGISPDDWRKLTRDTAHEFDSLVKQGWMDKNLAIRQPDGEFKFYSREQFWGGFNHIDGPIVKHTHRATGKFIVEHGACAEIFE